MQSTDTNSITIGGREFQRSGKTYIMGILNVTPDSFSDGGSWNSPDAALRRVEEMAAEGAHVIDIGGESTRPGYTAVSEQEEIQRTAPVIEAVKARFDIPISLDTCKAKVARAGIAAGADMINDIWGLRSDGEMAGVIARSGVPCCLMHNRKNAAYRDFMRELKENGFPVSEEQLRRGLLKTRWPGRFTVLKKHPLFIADGAHNEDAAKRLAESIEFYFTKGKIVYIIGMLRDKEYEKVIALTHAYAEDIITVTPPDNPRALSAYELAQETARVHKRVTAVDSLEEAVEMSLLLAGSDGVVIAFGSLSFMGRLIRIAEGPCGKAADKNGRSK